MGDEEHDPALLARLEAAIAALPAELQDRYRTVDDLLRCHIAVRADLCGARVVSMDLLRLMGVREEELLAGVCRLTEVGLAEMARRRAATVSPGQ